MNDVLVFINQFQKPALFIRINHTIRLQIHTISCIAGVKTTTIYEDFLLSDFIERIRELVIGESAKSTKNTEVGFTKPILD